MTTQQLALVGHRVTIEGPPQFQAYGARCTCGWVGPVQIMRISAVMDAEQHIEEHDE